MTNVKVVLFFLISFGLSYSISAQDKKKIFLANLQIGKSDINKEMQIEATLVESLRESVDVLTEREAYRYMTPQTKKKNPCNPQDILCTEKEIEPLIKSTQKCLALKSYSPEYCYLPYLKKFDLSSLLIQDIQQNPKELQIKLVLFTYSSDLFERENLFEKNILPFQLNFYLIEIPKFLLNPKYIIQVPKELYYSKDSDYDDYLSNGIKKAYNRVVYQINQSRKNLSDPYYGEYAPYFLHTSKTNLEFTYIPGFETLKDCETSDTNCFTDYNGIRKKVYTQKSFYMSKTEITQDQWMYIMDLYDYGKDKKFKNKEENLKSTNNPSLFKECGLNCPVESISYEDVLKFIKVLCKKEGYANACPYRLPTQKEWESSAAGWNGDTHPGATGTEGNIESALSKIAHYGKNCTVSYEGSIALNELGDQGSFNPIKKIGKLLSNFDTSFLEKEGETSNPETYFQGAASKCGTMEVGKKESNFFSLSDLAGNVAEFCEKTPKGLGVCGGSWASMIEKKELKSSSFLKVSKTTKHPTIGFRLIYAPREP